jgi:alkylmercury lyase
MNQFALDLLATQLVAHLDCTQDVACQQILRVLAETGQPLAPKHLAKRLHMNQEKVAAHLACIPDTEFDPQGQIVGWGITLVPTQHQFVLAERTLFTWCAFDTVLFPPLLQAEAQVQSECTASSQPITFRAGPEGIENLIPAASVLSLILPTARRDCVRRTFCQQSLFFQSEEAASLWMALHPEAMLLPVAEAATLGQMIAELWPQQPLAGS